MNAPKDPSTLVGLLECVDGTAAVIGKPHTLIEESHRASFQLTNAYRSVRLTREAGEALYELLGDWLGKPPRTRVGHGELPYDGLDEPIDEGYTFDPAELQRQARGE